MGMLLSLKLVVEYQDSSSIIVEMGLFSIITCQHVGEDPDTGDAFCKIEHLNPTGAEDRRVSFEGGLMGEEHKTIPVCLPLRVFRKKVGSGKIKSGCNQAEEVETTFF